MEKRQENTSIRLLIVPIAVVVVIINIYWISTTWNGFSLNALFINAVFITFIIGLSNLFLNKINKRLALRPSELLLIYIMLAIATGVAGHDTVEMLTQTIGYPFWGATPENEWEDIFHRYLPRWLMVEDSNVMSGFYTYDESFYEPSVFRAWLRPLLYWSGFLIALHFCMVCINIVLRKQWMERERLTFPIAQVPLGLMDTRRSIYKSKLFWCGFGGAVGLSTMNGLHHLYPIVPGITYGKLDLTAFFTEKPWEAMDAAYVEFLPFILGAAFFIPMTLSFSLWFFFWFWRMEMVFGSAIGYNYLPGFPGYWTQGMGAAIFMFILFIFWARQHLWQVMKAVFRSQSSNYAEDKRLYTFAVLGGIGSIAFLVFFLYYAGMAPWVGILFVIGFYATSIVVTRVRAELGPPMHDFPFYHSYIMTNILGTKRIDASSLTQFAMFKFVDSGHRNNAMPHIMEGFYLKDRLRVGQTGLFLSAMVIAIVLGSTLGLFGNVQRGYRHTGQSWVGEWVFPELANDLRYPSDGMNKMYIIYFSLGGSIVSGLVVMSRRFVWWPFHPLGYIMGNEWNMRYMWFSIFMAWSMKWVILKFGGLKAHRKAVPLFIGITVGDATMIAIWKLYGVVFNKSTLDIFYW
jgi:hypothetical protein